MRRIFEKIKVTTDRHGTPARVFWRGQLFIVSRVLDRWRTCSQWWISATTQLRGRQRIYFRLEARTSLTPSLAERPRVFEVFQQDDQWTISYLCD